MNNDNMKDILAKVETMELPEGAYLEFANMMKNEFNKKDKKKEDEKQLLRTEIINSITIFHGKHDIEIKLLKKCHYFDNGNRSYIDEYDYIINGTLYEQKTYYFMMHKLKHLYYTNLTTKYSTIIDNVTIESTLNEFRAFIKKEDEIKDKLYHEDADDNCYDYDIGYLFKLIMGLID